MKQMVCEMCESNDLIKQDGVFVCQSCGMKYSVEEAKKLITECSENVNKSNINNNIQKINNYFELANTAKEAGNYAETETYCNKIIEIEPDNFVAWMLKGEAAGWQSTLQNSRLDEGIVAFSKGINNAPEDQVVDLIAFARGQVKDLSLALISLRTERFQKWPDEDEAHYLISEMSEVINSASNFLKLTNEVIPLTELFGPIAIEVNNAVIGAWNSVIVPEYENDCDGHPDDYAFKQLVARGGYCCDLLDVVNNLMGDDISNVQRYKNIIAMHEYIMGSCSYEYKTITLYSYSGTSYRNEYCKNLELTASAKAIRREQISEYRQKIDDLKKSEEARLAAEKAEEERIEKEKAQKRFNDYWSEHAEEKNILETEKNAVMNQIKELEDALKTKITSINKERENIAGLSAIKEIEENIRKLTKDKEGLGFFKKKEKNDIQAQIDKLNVDLHSIKNSVNIKKEELDEEINNIQKEAQSKIVSLQTRLDEITTELTKAR